MMNQFRPCALANIFFFAHRQLILMSGRHEKGYAKNNRLKLEPQKYGQQINKYAKNTRKG